MKNRPRLINLVLVFFFVFGALGVMPQRAFADRSVPQTVLFSQDWGNTELITTNDDWSGVPSVMGYLGDGVTSAIDADPQTLLDDYTSVAVDVIANQSSVTISNGGVAEFDGITNPVVALQGSGTADAPFLLIQVDTTGFEDINVSYLVRDIDSSADNAVQQLALHYRVGDTGSFTNVPAAYRADASDGPSLTKDTSVDVLLPVDAEDQPLLMLRIMTTNATGSDEWLGIDDIS